MTSKLKPKVVNNNNWPSEQEIEEVIKETSKPDYPYENYILPDNANSKERMKYSLCKTILCYQRENNISDAKLTKMLGVSKDKLIDILFAKGYNLELNELLLHIPFEVKISNSQRL